MTHHELCERLVTYKHLPEPRRCKKPKRHRGACWGGKPVISEEDYKNYLYRNEAHAREELKKLSNERMDLRVKLRSTRARAKRLHKLLTDARWELMAELTAAGPDEVRQNPTLLGKERLVTRIDKALKEKP